MNVYMNDYCSQAGIFWTEKSRMIQLLAAAFQISPDTSGTTMTVISPATAMERLLMAPSTSPSSSAFEVPMACAEVPSASPFAIGSRTFQYLKQHFCNDISEDTGNDDADHRDRHDAACFLTDSHANCRGDGFRQERYVMDMFHTK